MLVKALAQRRVRAHCMMLARSEGNKIVARLSLDSWVLRRARMQQAMVLVE